MTASNGFPTWRAGWLLSPLCLPIPPPGLVAAIQQFSQVTPPPETTSQPFNPVWVTVKQDLDALPCLLPTILYPGYPPCGGSKYPYTHSINFGGRDPLGAARRARVRKLAHWCPNGVDSRAGHQQLSCHAGPRDRYLVFLRMPYETAWASAPLPQQRGMLVTQREIS